VFNTHNCVIMDVANKNFSDMDSKPQTGCIKHEIFTVDMKGMFLCQFNIPYCMEYYIFISKEAMEKLIVYLHILSLPPVDQRNNVDANALALTVYCKIIESTRGSHCHKESPNACTEVKM